MIEIFRTNVTTREEAEIIVNKIHAAFPGSLPNFDLEDCDRILRVDSKGTVFAIDEIIQLLNLLGFEAEVLPDEVPESLILDFENIN